MVGDGAAFVALSHYLYTNKEGFCYGRNYSGTPQIL